MMARPADNILQVPIVILLSQLYPALFRNQGPEDSHADQQAYHYRLEDLDTSARSYRTGQERECSTPC